MSVHCKLVSVLLQWQKGAGAAYMPSGPEIVPILSAPVGQQENDNFTARTDLGEVNLPGALDLCVVRLRWVLNAWVGAGSGAHPVHCPTCQQHGQVPLLCQKLCHHLNSLIFLPTSMKS